MTVPNNNTAKNNRFLFQLLGYRNLSLKIQQASIGSLNLGSTPFPTSRADIFVPSNKIDFSPLALRVLLSENYDEWMECVKWAFETTETNNSHIESETTGILTILNANNFPVMEVNYKGLAIINVTEIDFDLTSDEQTQTFDLTLSFDYYNVKNLVTGKEIVYSK